MDKKLITQEYIKTMITTDDKWASRALVALYKRQTDDEQSEKTTKTVNGMGFSKFDAEFLSSLANQINDGKRLSPAQLFHAKKKLGKYAGQLFRIALLEALDGK